MKANVPSLAQISSGLAEEGLPSPSTLQPVCGPGADALAQSSAALDFRPLAARHWVGMFSELFKARLTVLVLLTTLVGFYIGSVGPVKYGLMLHAVVATALVAAGASALNQLWERDLDARMRRTQGRPLPSGQMQPNTVLLIGCASSVLGLAYLAFAVNVLTASIGAASLLTYVCIYTPLKRVTWLNTVVGAVPGGLPPLMGWTAARGQLTPDAWSLFGILALWQLPHFMAIAWLYRDEYARAGFKMLPVVDPDGRRTGSQAVSHTLALVPVSLWPSMVHLTGPVYLFGASILGVIFIWTAIQFQRHLTATKARQLFYASILYLPLLLGLMVVDKIG